MYATELDSFVREFYQLWIAGITVHLDLEIIEEIHEEVTEEVTEVVANDCPSDVISETVKATFEQENIEDTEKENYDLKAEKAGSIFSCEICDIHITWENGLKVHNRTNACEYCAA